MTTSELIKLLQAKLQEHGDLKVQVDTESNDDWMDIEKVGVYQAQYIVLYTTDLR